ncbi:MAG: PaaI family thioesterase [Hyphomicrobiales bacterium]|nr:PaaI family thioesterase [Hyphomicrobiales bacterium]MCP5374115.1 PaaI family thioesterase [Hyphomicrobiales bacterium]
MAPDILDNLERYRARTFGFLETVGYRLEEWGPGRAVMHLDITAQHMNRNGVVHGGVLTALLDASCGVCGVYCTRPGNIRRSVTISLTTSFVNSVTDGHIRTEARMVSRGRKIYFAEAHAFDGNGVLIATASGTFRYIAGGENEEGVPDD